MVSAMASRDPEARPVTEGASLPGRPCWRRLYEQALDRAEAAEARSEALKRAEVSARCEAGYWKWQFESSRRKRLAAIERSKEACRAAKGALALQAEVARLGKLLADAGVESGRYSEMSLRREVARLRKAAPAAEVQAAEIRRLHKVLCKERDDKAALRRLLHETVPALGWDAAASRPARPGCVAVGRGWAAAVCVAAVRGGEGAPEGPTATHGGVGAGDVAGCVGRRSAPGSGEVASPEGRAGPGAEGERAAASDGAGVAAAGRDAGGGACKAACDPGGAVEGVARAQEREAGAAGYRPAARPAVWRSRPRAHAALRPGGTHRGAHSAGRCTPMFRLRKALRGGRCGGVGPGRDRGPRPPAGDPPSALAPELRVRLVAGGGFGAAGAAAVRQDALRHQRLVAGAV